MSSAVFSTSAAQGRPFLFDDEDVVPVRLQPTEAELFGETRPPQRVIPKNIHGTFLDSRLAAVTPASRLAVRPAPEMASTGIAEMDALTGGLPRGCLTEICGSASSGRTTLLLSALAAATRRGEFCAIVDAGDALDPQSAAAAGIELARLLWVRCGENLPRRYPSAALRAGSDTEKKNLKPTSKFDDGERPQTESHHADQNAGQFPEQQSLEQLLRATDLLLESGGFGLIALDLGDLPPQTARRIPLTTWFRFRRAVEHTPTVLLAIERQSIAGSCSSLLIKLGAQGHRIKQIRDSPLPIPTHAQLLTELEITAEIVRSRMDRKPARSAATTFVNKTAWAG